MCVRHSHIETLCFEVRISILSKEKHIKETCVLSINAFYMNGVISKVLGYMDCGSLTDVIQAFRVILEPSLAIICKQVSVL